MIIDACIIIYGDTLVYYIVVASLLVLLSGTMLYTRITCYPFHLWGMP